MRERERERESEQGMDSQPQKHDYCLQPPPLLGNRDLFVLSGRRGLSLTLQAPGKFSALSPVNKTASEHLPCAQPLAGCAEKTSDLGQPEWLGRCWGTPTGTLASLRGLGGLP